MITSLYYSKKRNSYYFTDKNTMCESCRMLIKEIVFIVEQWGANSKQLYFCKKCLNQIKGTQKINVFKMAIILDKKRLPKESLPIFTQPPALKDGSFNDLYDIEKHKSDETINRTKYSNSPMLTPRMQIGTNTHLIEQQNKATLIDINTLKTEVLIEYDNGIRQAEQHAQDIRETLKLYNFTDIEKLSLLNSLGDDD